MTYRDKMMTASLMAGLAFSNASPGLAHAMAHSLGGFLGLPHGDCNALLLEKVVLFNYGTSQKKYNQLANAMQLDLERYDLPERGAVISHKIASLRQQVNINQRLSDLGVQPSDIPQLSKFAFMDPCLATNPKETKLEDIETIYLQTYN